MNKEYKELLFQYLSMALPYNIIVRHADYLVDDEGNETGKFWYLYGYLCNVCSLDDMTTTIIESEGSDNEGYEHICDLERSLPYLRDMNDMTNEEYEELKSLCSIYIPSDSRNIGFEDYGVLVFTHHFTNDSYTFKLNNMKVINWLLKNHFDFMGLIDKGLAIKITKENNPYGKY